MSDRSSRCPMCGRLIARLQDGYCDDRCRGMARSGYRSPHHEPAALAPPRTAVEARLLVGAVVDVAYVPGCTQVAELTDGRRMVRVAAHAWDELNDMIAELREIFSVDEVGIFTLHQFTEGGLAPPRPPLRERAPK